MAGFVVESTSGAAPANPLRMVDLGESDCRQSRRCGAARAGWARWRSSRHLYVVETPGRLFYLEGQPDRLPREGEALRQWLDGRGGSFRGFEIRWDAAAPGPAQITAFVDPLGTRPIFLLRTAGRVLLSDKLSSIVANAGGLECDWSALLECAALGSLYSHQTTVRGAEMLEAGETVEIEGDRIAARRAAPVVLETGARPDPGAGRRLEAALRTAIAETWTDPETRLLLSGGLDSRLVLGLAPDVPLKALTFDLYPEETDIVRQVAAARGVDYRVSAYPDEHYCGVMRNAYLVAAGMHQARFINHLGMALEWRKSGIPCLIHGYFHNTVFRGWTSERWQKYPDLDFPLAQYMGRKAHYFDAFSCQDRPVTSGVLGLLSADGRREMKRQLGALADATEIVVADGIDITFERLLLKAVSRQVFFGLVHGWLEEIDVASPVFHPAVWEWYATTHPLDRFRDKAIYEIFQGIGYGLADIVNVNTGLKVGPEPEPRVERWKNQFWYPPARRAWRIWRRLTHAQPAGEAVVTPASWEKRFRQKPILEAFQAGIEEVRATPLLDHRAVDAAVTEYLAGDDRLMLSLWGLATAGQWQQFVANQGKGNPAVHEFGGDGWSGSGGVS